MGASSIALALAPTLALSMERALWATLCVLLTALLAVHAALALAFALFDIRTQSEGKAGGGNPDMEEAAAGA